MALDGTGDRRRVGPAAFGVILVLGGTAILAARLAGIEVEQVIADAGWPLYVIVPGVVLLTMAVVPARPYGVGFAVAGTVVITVGSILLYQERTGHWESWAYAWALCPTAAGLGTLVYGALSGRRDFAVNGLRVAAIGGALFTLGLVFFESMFKTGRVPELGMWWPVLIIAIGALIVVSALLDRSGRPMPRGGHQAPEAGT